MLWKMYVWLKKEPVDKIKRLIWDNGLYLTIMEFEEYIDNHHRYNNHWQNAEFFKKVVKHSKNLEDFILKPVNINQIYGWDIKQCFSVLKFIRSGTRLDDNAQHAQDRLLVKNYSSVFLDERIIYEENSKSVKVLSEPALIGIVIPISIKTEDRLEFLMDRLYNEALNNGDFEQAMEIRISKAYCFYGLLNIWSTDEFQEALYSPQDETQILKLTGRLVDYQYIQSKFSDTILKGKYRKYFE